MENQTDNQNNIDQIQQDATKTQVPEPQISETTKPSSNKFLVGLLSILLILALSVAAFFAYQAQKLAKELQVVSDDTKQNQTPQVPNPEPTTTIDSTANLKTYTNEKYGFEFRYPGELLLKSNLTDNTTLLDTVRNIYLLDPQYPDYEDRIIDIETHDLLVSPTGWQETDLVINGYDVKKYVLIGGDASIKFDIYQIKSLTGGVEIMVNKQTTELANQILSTFKFTE